MTPWTNYVGNWTVTGGVLIGGTNPLSSYGDVYVTNSWGDYSVQAQFQLPVGAYGGGLGGRMDPTTGSHYAAWIYPENSSGGSNVLKLIKFQTWSNFGYTNSAYVPMAQVSLAAVGTNWHTVMMTFRGAQITVSYDANQVLSVTDLEAEPYLSGAVSLDFYTDTNAYQFTVDNVVVNELPLVANNDSYSVVSGLTLMVGAPGVLANDTGGNGTFSAILATNVTHGTLNLNSNGGFTYTSTADFTGTDTFAYRASDGPSNSNPAIVTITVTADHPPVANNDAYTMLQNTTLTVAAPGVLGNDTDADGNSLTAVLVSEPANGFLTLTNNGGFTYTPTAGFAGTDSFTYVANDGLSNSANATVTILGPFHCPSVLR